MESKQNRIHFNIFQYEISTRTSSMLKCESFLFFFFVIEKEKTKYEMDNVEMCGNASQSACHWLVLF